MWLYKRRRINDDEKEWYNRLYGKQGKGTRVSRYYVSLKNEREEFRKKDKKIQSGLKNRAEYEIAYYDKSIKDSYNTIMSEKYSYIRKQYQIIAEPLIKVIYPKFLEDS
jgi:hypothetical protein